MKAAKRAILNLGFPTEEEMRKKRRTNAAIASGDPEAIAEVAKEGKGAALAHLRSKSFLPKRALGNAFLSEYLFHYLTGEIPSGMTDEELTDYIERHGTLLTVSPKEFEKLSKNAPPTFMSEPEHVRAKGQGGASLILFIILGPLVYFFFKTKHKILYLNTAELAEHIENSRENEGIDGEEHELSPALDPDTHGHTFTGPDGIEYHTGELPPDALAIDGYIPHAPAHASSRSNIGPSTYNIGSAGDIATGVVRTPQRPAGNDGDDTNYPGRRRRGGGKPQPGKSSRSHIGPGSASLGSVGGASTGVVRTPERPAGDDDDDTTYPARRRRGGGKPQPGKSSRSRIDPRNASVGSVGGPSTGVVRTPERPAGDDDDDTTYPARRRRGGDQRAEESFIELPIPQGIAINSGSPLHAFYQAAHRRQNGVLILPADADILLISQAKIVSAVTTAREALDAIDKIADDVAAELPGVTGLSRVQEALERLLAASKNLPANGELGVAADIARTTADADELHEATEEVLSQLPANGALAKALHRAVKKAAAVVTIVDKGNEAQTAALLRGPIARNFEFLRVRFDDLPEDKHDMQEAARRLIYLLRTIEEVNHPVVTPGRAQVFSRILNDFEDDPNDPSIHARLLKVSNWYLDKFPYEGILFPALTHDAEPERDGVKLLQAAAIYLGRVNNPDCKSAEIADAANRLAAILSHLIATIPEQLTVDTDNTRRVVYDIIDHPTRDKQANLQRIEFMRALVRPLAASQRAVRLTGGAEDILSTAYKSVRVELKKLGAVASKACADFLSPPPDPSALDKDLRAAVETAQRFTAKLSETEGPNNQAPEEADLTPHLHRAFVRFLIQLQNAHKNKIDGVDSDTITALSADQQKLTGLINLLLINWQRARIIEATDTIADGLTPHDADDQATELNLAIVAAKAGDHDATPEDLDAAERYLRIGKAKPDAEAEAGRPRRLRRVVQGPKIVDGKVPEFLTLTLRHVENNDAEKERLRYEFQIKRDELAAQREARQRAEQEREARNAGDSVVPPTPSHKLAKSHRRNHAHPHTPSTRPRERGPAPKLGSIGRAGTSQASLAELRKQAEEEKARASRAELAARTAELTGRVRADTFGGSSSDSDQDGSLESSYPAIETFTRHNLADDSIVGDTALATALRSNLGGDARKTVAIRLLGYLAQVAGKVVPLNVDDIGNDEVEALATDISAESTTENILHGLSVLQYALGIPISEFDLGKEYQNLDLSTLAEPETILGRAQLFKLANAAVYLVNNSPDLQTPAVMQLLSNATALLDPERRTATPISGEDALLEPANVALGKFLTTLLLVKAEHRGAEDLEQPALEFNRVSEDLRTIWVGEKTKGVVAALYDIGQKPLADALLPLMSKFDTRHLTDAEDLLNLISLAITHNKQHSDARTFNAIHAPQWLKKLAPEHAEVAEQDKDEFQRELAEKLKRRNSAQLSSAGGAFARSAWKRGIGKVIQQQRAVSAFSDEQREQASKALTKFQSVARFTFDFPYLADLLLDIEEGRVHKALVPASKRFLERTNSVALSKGAPTRAQLQELEDEVPELFKLRGFRKQAIELDGNEIARKYQTIRAKGKNSRPSVSSPPRETTAPAPQRDPGATIVRRAKAAASGVRERLDELGNLIGDGTGTVMLKQLGHRGVQRGRGKKGLQAVFEGDVESGSSVSPTGGPSGRRRRKKSAFAHAAHSTTGEAAKE